VEGANLSSDISAMIGWAVDTYTTWNEILCVCLVGALLLHKNLGHNPIGQSMYRCISEK